MHNPILRLKASMLLSLIYYHARSQNHSKNIAFFGLSDKKECQFFIKELNLDMSGLVDLIDLLSRAGFVRFVQLSDTLFVFLTCKGCDFVLNNQTFGSTFSVKN